MITMIEKLMYMVHFTQILEIVCYSAGYMIRAVHMLVLLGLHLC